MEELEKIIKKLQLFNEQSEPEILLECSSELISVYNTLVNAPIESNTKRSF